MSNASHFPAAARILTSLASLHFRLATLNSRRAREMLTVDVADTLVAAVSELRPRSLHLLTEAPVARGSWLRRYPCERTAHYSSP